MVSIYRPVGGVYLAISQLTETPNLRTRLLRPKDAQMQKFLDAENDMIAPPPRKLEKTNAGNAPPPHVVQVGN